MTPSNTKHLQLPVSLHANTPVQTYALVDSGASGNYILKTTLQYPRHWKETQAAALSARDGKWTDRASLL